jgi:GTPase involved in cell partitioning and DNA repair
VAFFQELELYRDDLLDKPAMLVVNKMDVAEAQFKYDEVKDQLRHLSGKFPTLLNLHAACDHLCGLVVRVPGYRSRFPALPDFLRSSCVWNGVHSAS